MMFVFFSQHVATRTAPMPVGWVERSLLFWIAEIKLILETTIFVTLNNLVTDLSSFTMIVLLLNVQVNI